MERYNHKNNDPTHLRRFLDYRISLSDFDKKLEAGALIDQISTIDVDNAYALVNQKIRMKGNSRRILTVITRIAAIFTLPLLMLTLWSLFIHDRTVSTGENGTSWQELSSPIGMRSQIVLPDGTNLWLNAGSKIRYHIPFICKKREIELSGEAYLEVAKNPASPFIVKSGTMEIEVLGTQFNVKSYPEENNFEVALKEGNVKCLFKNNGQQKFLDLEPGDYMVYNKADETVSRFNTDIEKYIAWSRNILILDETPMEEVAILLERWYGVEVIIADSDIKNYRFTTKFENESLFQVLELLKLSSPINIEYIPGKISKTSGKVNKSTLKITKNSSL
ncbi:MAG: hypothetical protein A2W90_00070 [Bacteroidetes bacterium GWF2_42_66]|nr:MAG: hypothetical protein A2W92_09250 [Bacteroidetes bacterium GWA2_42_15]OFX97896.1 MAG: hypothetical protein A2W89_07515 [Bacteroidetes bacterium GWE2_42_39]OFY44127.1 MAG: hypothetical protein A2W90_00070 [Bacteroidetes bacterium GWF2_42_66]HAZ03399.1 hypothetical protein [Marinilabiliales bacterium]HBL74631.1 hypothetical protein [Prolixibacteraceae bacterium]